MPSKNPILPVNINPAKKAKFAAYAKQHNRSMASILNDHIDRLLAGDTPSNMKVDSPSPTPAAGIDRDTIQQMIDESFANQAEEKDEDNRLDVPAYLNEQVRQAMARHRQTVKLDAHIIESIDLSVSRSLTQGGKLLEVVTSMVTGEWDGSTYIPDHAEVKRMIKVVTDENVHGYMDLLAKIDRLEEMILADGKKSKGGSGKGFSTLSTGVDKTLYEV